MSEIRIDRLSVIWKSDLSDKIKRIFFPNRSRVHTTMDAPLGRWLSVWRKKTRSNWTRMLRAMLNESWKQHPTKQQLYGHWPPISKIIHIRRIKHVGHWWRSKSKLIRDVLLWNFSHGWASIGRLARTYLQQLCM